MRTFGWLALVAIGAGACADPQGLQDASGASLARAGTVDVKSERASLMKADQEFGAALRSQGIGGGILANVTEDAYFLFPGEEILQGKTAISAVIGANFDAGSAFVWSPLLADVSVDGQIGYSFGTFEYTQDGAHGFWGKYIAVWRKQAGGAWLIEGLNLVFYRRPAGPLPAKFPDPQENGLGPFGPVDVAAEKQALLSVDAAFAQASVDIGEAEAFRQYADPHAVTLGNPDFIIGRKDIFEAHQGGGPGDQLSWTPLVADVGPLGDLGFTIGRFVFTTPDNGQTLSFYGKYLTVWKKHPNGTWKFVQDGGSGSPPPAAP